MAIKFILFLTVGAIALLFLLSNSSQNNHHCLHLHSGWEEDDFNHTNKIVCVFPEIDVDPTDNYISVHELTQWKLQHHQTKQLHRSKRDMIFYDKNHDGFVSFAEFEHRLPTSQYTDGDSFGYDKRLLEEQHFNASDTDGDGRLNLAEFHDFLHPADSNNPKLQQWLCREEVWERDTDRDGKVSYIEFVNGLFLSIRSYDEESYGYSYHSDDSKKAYSEFMFSQLDKDGDRYLSAIELLPIIGKVHPSWRYYARKQAEYFVSQAQVGKYGRLNLNEMIENADILYAAIFRDEFF
ncbi:uncharacterized protein LOC127076297 isoform X2 [Lathyrus oleraceus]|uniref:EF-hand domain-containing protein n=1 Tax=Pisum sativum TaxID=3888 RepID=A0A9D4XNZ0_PEA|nr:uncharacterized protein LOC127076297 isoform X2 [Pisum sativum]KAI5422430.1 hypothetical protein KIW84_045760 [Pisum sativum]